MQLTLALSSPFLEDLEGFGSYKRELDSSFGANNISNRSSLKEYPSLLCIIMTKCQSGTALAVPDWLLLSGVRR